MNNHRTVAPRSIEIIPVHPPFSSFEFLKKRFATFNRDTIHRCFSLSRSFGMRTVTFEEIPASGVIADENDELECYFEGYKCKNIFRVGFWKKDFRCEEEIFHLRDEDLIGYTILKEDSVPSKKTSLHVFEGVLLKYPHEHNCVPSPRSYRVRIGRYEFSITGVLYAQQNGLNKACAQVALRTLVSVRFPDRTITYREINALADIKPGGAKTPGDGLTVVEIRKVLEGFGVDFFDVDYSQKPKMRKSHPYQKYLYAGIESGAGALLGFHLEGPDVTPGQAPRHIIPFFGHTFNKDTWVPNAEQSYFNVGQHIAYIPSENWTSSFIGHDDNFGPNFCVPRLYVGPEEVDYVVELLPQGTKYSGIIAELRALQVLYSMEKIILSLSDSNSWISRLVSAIGERSIILRPTHVTKRNYLDHLSTARLDWEGNSEAVEVVRVLENTLPDQMWCVEISIPHLFPANERKIAEILLNPSVEVEDYSESAFNHNIFLLARIPKYYFFIDRAKNTSSPFLYLSSGLKSHLPLIKHS